MQPFKANLVFFFNLYSRSVANKNISLIHRKQTFSEYEPVVGNCILINKIKSMHIYTVRPHDTVGSLCVYRTRYMYVIENFTVAWVNDDINTSYISVCYATKHLKF